MGLLLESLAGMFGRSRQYTDWELGFRLVTERFGRAPLEAYCLVTVWDTCSLRLDGAVVPPCWLCSPLSEVPLVNGTVVT